MNQIDIYRKMTGEERLEQAFQLSKMVRELAIANIKSDYPHLSHMEVMRKLRKRIEIGTYGTKRTTYLPGKII